MATKGLRVELWQARNKRWFFHLRHVNGKVTGPSQGYSTRRGARRRALEENPGVAIVLVGTS